MSSKIVIFILSIISVFVILFLCIAREVVSEIEPSLPDITNLSNPINSGPSIILDNNGSQTVTFSNHQNRPVKIEQIPILLQQAFISAEDKNFYSHNGIDYYGLARAVINNLKGDHISGGSTISQQVIKNMVTGNERNMQRKIKEALLARRLEKNMTKDKILELYLNTIWLGAGAYGVNSASDIWFQKDMKSLDVAEIAFMAALPKGPAIIDPKKHPERAKQRRHYVLTRMCENGYIECSSVAYWDSKPLPVAIPKDNSGTANDWYEETVRRHIIGEYGSSILYSGGMVINEYKNSDIQSVAQTALVHGIDKYMKRHRKTNSPDGSVVVIDSRNGHVIAEVGGVNYSSGFDRNMQSKRQIGSVAKTIISMVALNNGYEPDTDVMDVPIHLDDGFGNIWSPGADGGDGMGVISLQKALADSRNQAFVRIAYNIGLDKIYDGFYQYDLYPQDTHLLPASMLGAVETTPMNVAIAYARAINGGKNVNAQFVKEIKDKTGHTLEKAPDVFQSIPDVKPELSDKIRLMLHDVVAHGTAFEAFKGIDITDIGGKTGTSNNVMDSWFAGYKGPYVVVVHVGYDNPEPMGEHEFGSTIAGPIASEVLSALKN